MSQLTPEIPFMASLWIRSGCDMKVDPSVETYQMGAHFKALIKAILVASFRTLAKLFSFHIFLPRCEWNMPPNGMGKESMPPEFLVQGSHAWFARNTFFWNWSTSWDKSYPCLITPNVKPNMLLLLPAALLKVEGEKGKNLLMDFFFCWTFTILLTCDLCLMHSKISS